MKKLLIVMIGVLSACKMEVDTINEPAIKKDIHNVLNDWHQAASDADFDRYFGYFEDDSSIFMGTDATERWTVAEFKPWSKPYFDRGKAWSFSPDERYIYLSDDGKTAWFDETLSTPNLGPSRGTGVLTKSVEGWKISHYNLTVPIPNEIVGTVVEQIDSMLNVTEY
ncbi:nuclear transport factor 2 family protein [Fulvivirga sp. M361]|uniref:nuclear transport factor 2 family protein n=1 Tax=Fulvivirga sp. M361 TaxID=2594266 RepID=UPI00117B5E3C|nr:nuclear transport factor 2 family protein [Fulvivirga sp. M361]TRX58805.1 nuclear transport factor 2 family protein [Fulvivirga sp. M361]